MTHVAQHVCDEKSSGMDPTACSDGDRGMDDDVEVTRSHWTGPVPQRGTDEPNNTARRRRLVQGIGLDATKASLRG